MCVCGGVVEVGIIAGIIAGIAKFCHWCGRKLRS